LFVDIFRKTTALKILSGAHDSTSGIALVSGYDIAKDKYGAGYLLQLNLTSSDKETQDRAMDCVRERLHPGATLQSKQAKTLHVALPRDVSLADVFRALYSADRFEAGSINQFLFSQSSLEDVFLALGE
jgi:hypothetical protein